MASAMSEAAELLSGALTWLSAWLFGVGAAILIKLSSSIDDVVWLAPFLTSNCSQGAKLRNAGIYISVCLTQTCVAMFIATSGNNLVQMIIKDTPGAWSSEKILTVGAGVLLALYSVKLLYECLTESEEGDGDSDESSMGRGHSKDCAPEARLGGEDEDCEAMKEPLAVQKLGDDSSQDSMAEDSMSDEASEAEKKESGRSQGLFVIAFLGSVDDLTLFVPMLVGKTFDIVQLVVGGFTAATVIVCICIFLGLCKPIADCLSRIPLAAIVMAFAVLLLVKGFTCPV